MNVNKSCNIFFPPIMWEALGEGSFETFLKFGYSILSPEAQGALRALMLVAAPKSKLFSLGK